MATLPADRSKLAIAQQNQVAGKPAAAKANIDAMTEAYDTIDLLNQKVDDHLANPTIPDGSVTTPKLANSSVTTNKIANGAVTNQKIADGTLTANKFVPGALTNETQNALRITQLENDRVKKTGDVVTGQLTFLGNGQRIHFRPEVDSGGLNAISFSNASGVVKWYAGHQPSTGNYMIYDVQMATPRFQIFNNGYLGIGQGGLRLIAAGTGSPEGVVVAPVGSIYLREDGGQGSTLYVKESGTGNTGWKAVQTA